MRSQFIKNTKIILAFCMISFTPVMAFAAETSEEKVPELCVQGVIIGDDTATAIINDKSARAGDMVLGAKITKISNSGIEFQYQGKTFFKKLGDGCEAKLSASMKSILNKQEKSKAQISKGMILGSLKQPYIKERFQQVPLNQLLIVIVIALFVMIAAYVYVSLSLQMMAKKTSTPHAWLAWIPLINSFLMCNIARVSCWWLLLPVILFGIAFSVAIIIGITGMYGLSAPLTITIKAILALFFGFIWYRIALARNKSGWIGLTMILPLSNLIPGGDLVQLILLIIYFLILGYLGFSK